MLDRYSDRHPDHPIWYLVPVRPRSFAQNAASFRRWNIIIVSIFAGLTLGLFLVALGQYESRNAPVANHLKQQNYKQSAPVNPGDVKHPHNPSAPV